MKKSRKGHGSFPQSDRRPCNETGVHDKDSILAGRAHYPPARVGPDGLGTDRTGEDEIRIPPGNVFQSDLAGGALDVRVDIFRTGDVDQLVHEAAGADGYERRVPDVPEYFRARTVRVGRPHSIERLRYRIDDGLRSHGIPQNSAQQR